MLESNLQGLITQAVKKLKNGEIIGLPTETVYGLAACISDDKAIRKIFEIKERPFFDPLIVHVSSVDQAKSLVLHWPESASLLAKAFWPGPLTLVLPKNQRVSSLITSGLETVAIRCPNHPVALQLVKELGEPVAAPSANKFGKTSPTSSQHVQDEFQGKVFTIDGGDCSVGIESTILKINETEHQIELTILRAGIITSEMILKELDSKLGKKIQLIQPGTNIEAPGQIKHHYMPTIPLVTIEKEVWEQWGGGIENIKFNLNQSLSLSMQKPILLQLNNKPEQAARELYSELRNCSASGSDLILFKREDYHEGELWMAIIDRLKRASSYYIDSAEK